MTDKIIELMARALYEQNKMMAEKHRPDFPIPPYEHDTMGFYAGQARAALTAFMDATREPSEAMLNAYYDKAPGFYLLVRDKRKAATRYQAMHDKLREEALGDE